MKLSSIKLSVFTDLVTVCLHARTDTHTHSQTHTHAQANMQSHMRIMYVLLRKLVCVSFMNIIVPQIGTTVTQLWQDETRRGTRHKAQGASKRGFVRRLQHTKNSFSIWL